jgi:lysozyme family protein
MANFETALTLVLRHEDAKLSGIVTEDSGGRTRFGIAERFHPQLGNAFYCGTKDTALEIASEIYRRDYWDAIQGEEIASQQVASKLLDMAVNMGMRQAAVLCQRAVNAVIATRIVEDGAIGGRTILAINSCEPQSLIDHLREASAGFYRHIANVRPDAAQYLRGWLARAQG